MASWRSKNGCRCFSAAFDTAPGRAISPCNKLLQVGERIDDVPAHAHMLGELTVVASLSGYQTIRGFARLTKLTPHAYVIQRRLEAARRLIRQGFALAEAARASRYR